MESYAQNSCFLLPLPYCENLGKLSVPFVFLCVQCKQLGLPDSAAESENDKIRV